MNKKRLFFIPLVAIASALITSCVPGSGISEGGGLNTVTITFNATEDGYYQGSTSSVKEEVVIKEVRYGITWGKLVADHEKPTDPVCNKIGYDFSFYKLGNLQIRDSFKITSDISLTAVYSTSGHRFCYDPWDTVIDNANQGLEELQLYYGNDPDYKTNGGTFIGLERDLEYNGANYKVRVIGENADPLASGNNMYSALTFEFVELLPGFAYDASDTSSYENSSLRAALNGRVLNNIEETVRVNLQQVNKKTNEGTGTAGLDHMKTTQDYVFVPSMYELGILNDENGNITEREGYIYDYYKQHNTNEDRKKSYRGRTGQLVESTYWTRSPDTTIANAVWPIDNNGHTGVEDAGVYNTVDPRIALGISPCFAIGASYVDPDVNPIFYEDSWEKIIDTANRGYNALKKRYKIDMANNNDTFIGLTHPLEVTLGNGTVMNYEVRVIGENHDYYYELEVMPFIGPMYVKYNAPLTFQFTSVVGQREDMYVSGFVNEAGASWIDLDQNKNWHYYNSMAERCLEDNFGIGGTMDTTWSKTSGDKTLLQMLPDCLQKDDGIRSVEKTSWCAEGINTVTKETYDYRLFPLSYNEYGAYQQNVDTYGSNFSKLIKDDGEKPYEYYDYTLVQDKDTKAEKYKEIERRRIFNNVKDEYKTFTKSDVTCLVPDLDKKNDGTGAWAHSYLRSINMVHFERLGLGNYAQKYATLHPTGEARDWAGMPIAESLNDYLQQSTHKNYRIGIVPAFSIGRDAI